LAVLRPKLAAPSQRPSPFRGGLHVAMGDDEDEEKTYQLIEKGKDKPRTHPFPGSQKFTGIGLAKYVKDGAEWDTFEGSFNEGLRQGKGVYKFKLNGDKYEGIYEENLKHGFGKMTYSKTYGNPDIDEADPPPPPRGGCYLGNYTAGLRGCAARADPDQSASEGTFTYVNGDMYVGQWRSGKKHGRGTYTYAADETQLIGEWENGKITNGMWLFPNGTFYTGRFRYNKPFGKGVWVFKNGNQLTGEYIQKEDKTDGDEPPPDDEEGGAVKPDPKVFVYFKHHKDTCVHGGTMFQQKPA